MVSHLFSRFLPLFFVINSLFASWLVLLFLGFLLAVHVPYTLPDRCRTDRSDYQLSLGSHNHLHIDLVSVPPCTPTWNYLHSCLNEFQHVTPLTCFFKAHVLNNIPNYMSMCRTVQSLFDFLPCFCFLRILTIKPQTWPRNNLPVCPFMPQSCLITLVFCPPRLMAPLISKTLLLSSIPLPLPLCVIGNTSPEVICVLNSFLPASVVTL